MTNHAYVSGFILFCLHSNGRNDCNAIKAKKRFFLALHLLAHSSSSYSQSKAPFFHSYINPIVKINKKTIIDQNPNKPILLREIAQGNKKVTSKSNIINRIETR
jgi:hypothetical protein